MLRHANRERDACMSTSYNHAESEDTMAFLTIPSAMYRESYLAALREFQAEGRNLKPSFEEIAADFQSFVQRFHDQANRSKLKPGRVPSSEFG